jgi:hypothetical protein
VEKCAKFPFCSKVEAAYGLDTVITVITVIDSPSYIDHMDDSSSLSLSSSEFSRLISVPVRRSDLRVAKSGPPHSGESLVVVVVVVVAGT